MSYWTCPNPAAREICVDGECYFGDHELPDLCHLHNEEIAALIAERDDWRDRCTEAQAERDAAREERDELQRRLDAVVEAIEADARVETKALVQAVRDIAEGREP